MKNILTTTLFVLFLNIANSQTLQLKPNPSLFKKQPYLNSAIFDTLSLRPLNNSNYIANLKQDNMPCVIPKATIPAMPNSYKFDMTYLGQIPNLWKKKDIGR